MRMNSTHFVVILALAFSAACSKDNPISITQPTPTTPTVSFVSLTVVGQTPLMAGQTAQFRAMAGYSDGSTREVTPEWSSSAPPFATVNANGMVTAIKPGNAQINAKFENSTSVYPVSVMPTPVTGTPWSQLPPLSDAAKSFIVEYNLNYVNFLGGRGEVGTVKRWNSFPIPIYADPGFRPQDLVDATSLWQTATGGKITFRIVSDPASAAIVLDFVWPPPFPVPDPNGCGGVEGPDRVVNNVILTGFGHYAFRSKPECAGNGDHRIGLAHGIGHILGLGGHTASGSDVMGDPQSDWRMSSLLSEIINWLYSVPPGTKPI